MSDEHDADGSYFATLGLPPDATLHQVKARYRELNDAYLKILELSRARNAGVSRHDPNGDRPRQVGQKADPGQVAPSQKTHTEPIAVLKEKLAKGAIDKAQFAKMAKERFDYLEKKPFSELSDSEFDERLKGFEGLKIS